MTGSVPSAAPRAATPKAPTARDLDRLSRGGLFAEMPERLRAALLPRADVVTYQPGEVVFAQGGMPEHLHVVVEGLVALVGTDAADRKVPIELLEPGEHFILAAVLRDARHLMGAHAVKRSRVLRIPADAFRGALLADAEAAVAVAAQLAADFRGMVREVKSLKLKAPIERFAAFLLSLTDKTEGGVSLRLPVPAGVVAGRLGITAESFSRCLRRLNEVGVTGRGRSLEVADIRRLADLCATDDVADH